MCQDLCVCHTMVSICGPPHRLHGRFDTTTVPSGRFLARYDDIYLHPYQLANLVALMYSTPYTIYPIFQIGCVLVDPSRTVETACS